MGRAAVIVRSAEIPLMRSDANIPAVGRSFANRPGVSDNDARDRSLYTYLCDSHAGLKSHTGWLTVVGNILRNSATESRASLVNSRLGSCVTSASAWEQVGAFSCSAAQPFRDSQKPRNV